MAQDNGRKTLCLEIFFGNFIPYETIKNSLDASGCAKLNIIAMIPLNDTKID
jgi:hypothetical protein